MHRAEYMYPLLTALCVALTGCQSSMRRALHANDIERVEYVLAKKPAIIHEDLGCDFDSEIKACSSIFFVRSAEMMSLLLKHGANPNDIVLNVYGWKMDVLSFFITRNDDERIPEILLEFGAFPNGSASSDYGTPIQIASANQCLDIVRTLLDYNADPNLQYRSDGSTALHSAASNGELEIVKLLIAAGARPDIRNHSGQTAYDVVGNRCPPYSRSELHAIRDILSP